MTTKYDDMVWKILGGMPIEVFDEDDDTVWENETWELVKVRTEGDYKDSRSIGSANLITALNMVHQRLLVDGTKSDDITALSHDIFNNILLGRAIFLDHGFDLIPGFRVITIYAHLSHIEKNIIPGAVIKAGDVIGKSGNSGTRESTVGLKAGAHLHWEMILQKGKQEIYLGKDVPNPQLYAMLRRIFYKANP